MIVHTRQEADDFREAVHLAGGRSSEKEVQGSAGTYWIVGAPRLPDVGLFIRALGHVGFRGRVTYSAGSGWGITALSAEPPSPEGSK